MVGFDLKNLSSKAVLKQCGFLLPNNPLDPDPSYNIHLDH